MRNLTKVILAAIVLSFGVLPATSQTNTTYSPYSRYGIGEVRPQGYAFSRAMGGLTQGIRSRQHVNHLNPASYTAQDTLSFIFDFGMEGSAISFKQNNQSSTMTTGNIHHLAIQFPVTRWWGASAGLQPYSDVGYRIRYTQMDDELLSSIGAIKHAHSGEGGITQAYFGSAFQPFKFLSIGFNASYLFGAIEHHTDVLFPTSTTRYKDTYSSTSLVIRDFIYSIGAQTTHFFGDDMRYRLIAGVTLDNKKEINAKETTLHLAQIGSRYDTVYYSVDENAKFTIPSNISAGLTLSYKNRIMGGVEYSTQDWSNTTLNSFSEIFTRSQTMRLGLEYTPDRFHLRSYIRRVSYRAGVRYTETYLNLRGNQIEDRAVSFGVGLPFRRTSSSFNISFDLGRKGTLNDNLVEQTYGTINFGVTFYDIWFVKPKYH